MCAQSNLSAHAVLPVVLERTFLSAFKLFNIFCFDTPDEGTCRVGKWKIVALVGAGQCVKSRGLFRHCNTHHPHVTVRDVTLSRCNIFLCAAMVWFMFRNLLEAELQSIDAVTADGVVV